MNIDLKTYDPKYQFGELSDIAATTRDEYEAACRVLDVEPAADESMVARAYGLTYAEFHKAEWAAFTRDERLHWILDARRLRGIKEEQKAQAGAEVDAEVPVIIFPGTQASAVAEMMPGALALGHVVDGVMFKPDAHPAHRGECARCGRPGVWISGAAEILCGRHQDDY